MALYIKPPLGSVSLNKLHSFVMKRLAFLHYIKDHTVEDVSKLIEREDLARNSECLIEGTVKDKISHFTLRFLCSSDSILQDFFVENELKLFSYRLLFCDFLRLIQMLRKACEQAKFILFNNNYILKSYKKVLKSLIFLREELEFVIKKKRNVVRVPFTLGLKFVKDRLYPLHLGFIKLPLTDLKSLLMCLFEELVIEGLNQTKVSLCLKELDDSRMEYMSHKIKKWLHYKLHPIKVYDKYTVNWHNLMDESKHFPLCMHNLHNLLLKQHRLKHVSRIQYTLFLKEIGVPSPDVIQLFMKEYSVPLVHEGSYTHCSHNWTESEMRYIYSIEHLYGMRGARKDYKAHNCKSLQNFYDSEGGCPFVSFDDQHLQYALQSQNLQVNDIEDIISLAQKKKYHNACHSYLSCKVNIYQQERRTSNYLYDSETSKSVNISLESFKSNSPNTSSILKSENNLSLSTSTLTFSSPSDFYSILSSCAKK